MRISVVMATWNGERHLRAQLVSILGQTRLPDELVVVDDASDDVTCDLLDDVASKAPFKVTVVAHPERRGSTATFEDAIRRADGDLICLADQDDLWFPHKLSRLESVMTDRGDAPFVFTDAGLVDGDDHALPGSLWETRKFTPRLQEAVRVDPLGQLAQRFLVTGCTMAFRADHRDLIFPIPVEEDPSQPAIVHDRWIALVLSAVGTPVVLDQRLMAYRIHADQQIGISNVAAVAPPVQRVARKLLAPREHTVQQRDQQIRLLEEVRARIERHETVSDALLLRIDDVLGYLRFRRDQPENRAQRVAPIVRQALLGTYSRHSRGAASMLVDLLRR